jgi:hypothetical protein
MRTSDIDIVKPTKGMLAASGAAHVVLGQIAGAGIQTATPDNSTGFSRDSSRPAPYNLMLSADALSAQLRKLPRPPAYLPWATGGASLPPGAPATSAEMKFSVFHTTSWTYRPGQGASAKGRGYLRADDQAAPGGHFLPTNVLVLRVHTRDAGYRDPAGNPVPETILTGSGEAMLLHNGRVIRGTWFKGEASKPLTLKTRTGQQLQVPPGHTWIELVPDTGSVTLGH